MIIDDEDNVKRNKLEQLIDNINIASNENYMKFNDKIKEFAADLLKLAKALEDNDVKTLVNDVRNLINSDKEYELDEILDELKDYIGDYTSDFNSYNNLFEVISHKNTILDLNLQDTLANYKDKLEKLVFNAKNENQIAPKDIASRLNRIIRK